MAVQWIESFDKYGTTIGNTAQGGWGLTGTPTLADTGGRTGRYMQIAASSTSFFRVVDSHTEGTIGFAFYQPSANTNDIVAIGVSSGTTPHITVRLLNTGAISVYQGTAAAGVLLGTSAVVMSPAAVWYYVEVSYVIHGSTGSVVIRVNGAQVFSVTGADTQDSGSATRIWLGSAVTSTNQRRWDDVYWSNQANDWQGPIAVQCYVPNAVGTHADWARGGADSGSNYGQVDEDPSDDDTSYITSADSGHTDTYGFPDLSGNGAITAVQVTARARTETSGRQFSPAVLLNGTVYAPGVSNLVSTTYTNVTQLWLVNPDTSNPFTPSEVNGMEAGVKIIA